MRLLLLTALSLSALTAATQGERVFPFQNLTSPPQMQDVSNVLRTLGGLPNVELSQTAKTITVQGSEADLDLAAWLFQTLDQTSPSLGVKSYAVSTADSIRIFYLANGRTMQDLQEDANAVRTVLELPRVFPIPASMAIIVRASPNSVASAALLFSALDMATPPATSSQSPAPDGTNVVSVFYVQPDMSQQGFQEIGNAVRVVPELTRVFPQFRLRAIAIKGTPERTALAAWLINELNGQARVNTAPQEFHFADSYGPLVRVFALQHIQSAEVFQSLTNTMRAETGITRLFPCTTTKLIAVRGTDDQVALADKLVQQLDVAK